MIEVAVCLDCGSLATDACRKDARYYNSGTSRIDYVYVYEEDAPTEACECHVLVDFCEECNAVANDYCRKLASVGKAKLVERSLVKMSEVKLGAVASASKWGLWATHAANNYIYLVDKDGEPLNTFKGLDGKQNKKVNAPYLVCDKHTKKDWDAYLKEHPNYKDPTQETPNNNSSSNTTKPDNSQNSEGNQQ